MVKLAVTSAVAAQVAKMVLKGQKIPQKEMVLPVVAALAAKYVLDKNLRVGFKSEDDMKFWATSLVAAYLSLKQF